MLVGVRYWIPAPLVAPKRQDGTVRYTTGAQEVLLQGSALGRCAGSCVPLCTPWSSCGIPTIGRTCLCLVSPGSALHMLSWAFCQLSTLPAFLVTAAASARALFFFFFSDKEEEEACW